MESNVKGCEPKKLTFLIISKSIQRNMAILYSQFQHTYLLFEGQAVLCFSNTKIDHFIFYFSWDQNLMKSLQLSLCCVFLGEQVCFGRVG